MELNFHLSMDPKPSFCTVVFTLMTPGNKETSDTHVFQKGNYSEEGVKTESVKPKSSRSDASINAIKGQ